MHCSNLKVVADLTSPSFPSSRVVRNSNNNDSFRFNRIIACSANAGSGQGQSSIFSRTETYALLKQQLEVAAKSEDYKEAARLRDSLRVFEEEEPVLHLRRLLKDAIAEERFEDCLFQLLPSYLSSRSFPHHSPRLKLDVAGRAELTDG